MEHNVFNYHMKISMKNGDGPFWVSCFRHMSPTHGQIWHHLVLDLCVCCHMLVPCSWLIVCFCLKMPKCSAVNCANGTFGRWRIQRFLCDPARRQQWVQNCRCDKWTATHNSVLYNVSSWWNINKRLRNRAVSTMVNKQAFCIIYCRDLDPRNTGPQSHEC